MAYLEPVERGLPAGGVTFLQLAQYLASSEGKNSAADNDDYEDMDSSDSSGDYDEILINVHVDESITASYAAYFGIDDKEVGTLCRDSRSSVCDSTCNSEFQSYHLSHDIDHAVECQQGQPRSIDADERNRDSMSPLYNSHDRDSELFPTVPEGLYNSHQPPDTAINPTGHLNRIRDLTCNDVTAHYLNPLPEEMRDSIDTNPDTTQHTTSFGR
jgi:hypothetical protein